MITVHRKARAPTSAGRSALQQFRRNDSTDLSNRTRTEPPTLILAATLTVMERPLADDETLRRHATVLTVLADAYGLSDLGLGDDPGELIAAVAPGRTYFDIARFEMAVTDTLGVTVHVTPSTAQGAHVRGPLTAGAAA